MKKKITDNVELRNTIFLALNNNKKKYGAPHCPCVPPILYNKDTICPCKEFRENTPCGKECHCGLYIKEEN